MAGVLYFLAAAGFAVGVLARSLYAVPKDASAALLLVAFALAILWQRQERATYSKYRCASIVCFALALGLMRIEIVEMRALPFIVHEHHEVSRLGVVAREPDVRESSQHLYVMDAEYESLILITTDAFLPIAYGDRITYQGTVEVPESFETELGRVFNYPGYLRAKGVTHMIAFAEVHVVEHGQGNPMFAFLYRTKRAFMRSLESVIREPYAGLAEGLLLGEKRALGGELEDVFRTTGIIHIVVLSGYNLMLVADAMMRTLAVFFRPRVRTAVGALALVGFALMVGLSATVVRATIMALLVLIARATGRTTEMLRALTLAAVVMIIVNPYLLTFDPGFQLSFLATLGLIVVAPYLETWLRLVPTRFQIREYMTATLSTQIMVLPLLLYLMGIFSLAAVPANIFVLPMVPVAMLFSFAAGSVAFIIPQLAALLALIAHASLAYIAAVPSLIAHIPFAAITIPPFPFWLVIVAYAFLAYVLVRMRRSETSSGVSATHATGDVFDDWTIVSYADVATEVQGRPSFAAAKEGRESFPFR